MGAVISFFASPLGKWVIIGLLMVAAFASGWVKGNDRGTQKLVDYVQEQAQEAIRIGKVRTEVTERVVTKYIETRGATKYVTETIEKEVTRYADANPANMCIDSEWVRLHNAAAANSIPKPPAVPGNPLRTTSTDYLPYSLTSIGYGNGQLR